MARNNQLHVSSEIHDLNNVFSLLPFLKLRNIASDLQMLEHLLKSYHENV